LLREAAHYLTAPFPLQIERNAPARPEKRVVGNPDHPRTLYPDHFGAMIRQHHRSERTRTQARHFDDLQSGEWASHGNDPSGGTASRKPATKMLSCSTIFCLACRHDDNAPVQIDISHRNCARVTKNGASP
jgi:hypothetical protein